MIAFLVCLLVAGALGFEDNRIVGGALATKGQFAWVVSLQSRGSVGGHFCGGSILSENYVLTASHCVNGKYPGMIQVQYGIVDIKERGNVIDVQQIIMHEDYVHGGNYPNDIAILRLARPMNLDDINSKAVVLPDELPEIPNYIIAQLCGWGYRTSEEAQVQRYLLFTNLPLFSHDNCEKYLGVKYDRTMHICAGTIDGQHKQCSGDSGGPLTFMGIQYGVVSWSFKPCTVTSRPGIFTNVPSYRDWIREKTGL